MNWLAFSFGLLWVFLLLYLTYALAWLTALFYDPAMLCLTQFRQEQELWPSTDEDET